MIKMGSTNGPSYVTTTGHGVFNLEIEMQFKVFELHGFRIHIVWLIQRDNWHRCSHLTWNQVVVRATGFVDVVDVSILD